MQETELRVLEAERNLTQEMRQEKVVGRAGGMGWRLAPESQHWDHWAQGHAAVLADREPAPSAPSTTAASRHQEARGRPCWTCPVSSTLITSCNSQWSKKTVPALLPGFKSSLCKLVAEPKLYANSKESLGNEVLNFPKPEVQEARRKHIRRRGWRPGQEICCTRYRPLQALQDPTLTVWPES